MPKDPFEHSIELSGEPKNEAAPSGELIQKTIADAEKRLPALAQTLRANADILPALDYELNLAGFDFQKLANISPEESTVAIELIDKFRETTDQEEKKRVARELGDILE